MSEANRNKKKSELGKRSAGDHPNTNPSPKKIAKHTDSQAEDSVIDTWRSTTNDAPTLEKEKTEVMSDHFNEEEEEWKWKTLEHHSIRFPPFYKPHGVPLLHKGAKLYLNPELEEIANYWAQIIGSEFAEKERVKTNFKNEFMKRLSPDSGVTEFDDLDFTEIKNYLEKCKEDRANRSADEKKKEREENAAFEAYYRYCIIDGEREKVSTIMVEPPGIFRGRGEHPLAGNLKSRILPEFVTINVGPDNMIPKWHVPGHAWKAVVSKPEWTWLNNFKDENNEKATVKYLFLAADSKIKSKNDRKKYK